MGRKALGCGGHDLTLVRFSFLTARANLHRSPEHQSNRFFFLRYDGPVHERFHFYQSRSFPSLEILFLFASISSIVTRFPDGLLTMAARRMPSGSSKASRTQSPSDNASEKLIDRVSTTPMRLRFFHEIPSWQKDNEYILSGYRLVVLEIAYIAF